MRHRAEPWSDRYPVFARFLAVLAGVAVAGVASAALVMLTGPPPEPERVAVEPPPPQVVEDPELVLNTEHCQKGAEILRDVGDAVTTADSIRDDAVIDELDDAQSRMQRRAEVPSPRLSETFGEMETNLQDLRRAIRAEGGVRAALDDTTDLISTLDRQCHDLLVPEDADYPG